MYKKLLCLALLGIPQLGFAQSSPTSARFYVGAGANLLRDFPSGSEATTLVGPSLTAGMQLTPRLAVQVSAAYHWQHRSFTYPDFTYGSGTVSSNVRADFYSKYFTVPVLLRYTFTEPAAPFHFDGLAGLTLVHGTFKSTVSTPISGYGYFPDNYHSSSTKANLTLGPAVRYRVAPNVELTASGLLSAALGDEYYRFSDRLFLNVLVGAHYTFGTR